MFPERQRAILAITLHAAFADGAKHDREREEIRRIADSLAIGAGAPDLTRLYQDVLLKRETLEAAAATLTGRGERQLAYEMVYGIGKAHGYTLDQGHIKHFIAAAGVGHTSQYLEQFGRKLLGGLLGKAAGGLAGRASATATGLAFSFATTYALGQVAKRYYAGGRKMSTAVLRDTFQGLLHPAKEMQPRYLPQIRQTAGGLDAARVMALVREGTP